MLDIGLSETVFRVSRLRLADGLPMAIERETVPMRFLGGPEQVGDSLYGALEEAGFQPVRAVQRLRAVVVGPTEAALLDVSEGSPALEILRIAYGADGRRVGFNRSTYRSDIYDFVAELTLPSNVRERGKGAQR
jgi:GntR family transcriptional regulator